jgi:cytochrome c556
MRKMNRRGAGWQGAICAALLLSPLVAFPALDLADFDDELMRSMDDAYKDLEPVLGASNATAARADLATLKEGYQWTLEYFTTQEKDGKEGIEILKAGSKLLDEIEAGIGKKDFTGAAAKARDLHANCKSCHDKYKPEKR